MRSLLLLACVLHIGHAYVILATSTLDFPNTLAQVTSDLTLTATGAAVGDLVTCSYSLLPGAGGVLTAYVSSSNTITVRLANINLLAAINLGSMTVKCAVDVYEY